MPNKYMTLLRRSTPSAKVSRSSEACSSGNSRLSSSGVRLDRLIGFKAALQGQGAGTKHFPVQCIQSPEVLEKINAHDYIGALSIARSEDGEDIETIHAWMEHVMPTMDVTEQVRMDNRLNNSLYKVAGPSNEFPIVLKKMHDHELALREQLAYNVSEFLGFHLVPPTVARRGNMMTQVFLEGFTPGTRQPGTPAILSDRAKVFYYIINQKDDNEGNQMRDSLGTLMIIDNESAFDTSPSLEYERALTTVLMSNVFTASMWEDFSSKGKKEWAALLEQKKSPLSKDEFKSFVARIERVKSIVQAQIDEGKINIGTKRKGGFLHTLLGKGAR